MQSELEAIAKLRAQSRAALRGLQALRDLPVTPHGFTMGGTPTSASDASGRKPQIHGFEPQTGSAKGANLESRSARSVLVTRPNTGDAVIDALLDPNPRIVPVFAQPQQSTNTGSLSRKSKRKPKFNTSPRIASEGEKMIAAERGLAQSRRLYAKGISRSSSPIFQFHNERLKFNIDTALHHEDDFYDEMQQFRSLHADLFMNEAEAERNERSQNHQKPRRSEVVQTPSSPEHNHSSSIGIDDRKLDAEVYTSGFFTINDRLFPERSQHSPFMDMNGLYADDDPPVKVSIPLSKLRTQSKSYKPHRRNSFDPTDSLDISRHLHKGYETSGILRNKTCFSDGRSYLRDHLIKTRRRGEKVQL